MVKATMIYLKHLSALDNNYPTKLRTVCTVGQYKYISQVSKTRSTISGSLILNEYLTYFSFLRRYRTSHVRLWDEHSRAIKSQKKLLALITTRKRSLGQGTIFTMSVILSMGRRESLYDVTSCLTALSHVPSGGGSLSLVPCSFLGVSVQRDLSGGSLSGRPAPYTVKSGWYTSYWNALFCHENVLQQLIVFSTNIHNRRRPRSTSCA